MKNHRYLGVKLFFIFSIIVVSFGCTPEKTERSENEVTIAFFDAVYNKKDLKSVTTLSSVEFKKEVEKYRTVRNFSRRLLNLSFDSVEVETQKSKTQIIDELNIKITMTALLTGNRNGSIYKEVKKISLVKEGNVWLVDKILSQ